MYTAIAYQTSRLEGGGRARWVRQSVLFLLGPSYCDEIEGLSLIARYVAVGLFKQQTQDIV